MRTITSDDEDTLWSKSNYLMGTRLLPSSDDSNNNNKNISRILTEPELR
jgi:hypothetical protein